MAHVQRIIIDGYNVVHADPQLSRMAAKDLERAREKLLDRLRSYVASRHTRVSVVFDGKGMLADAAAVLPGKLQVLFSPEGQSADELILSTLERSRHPKSYIVVTSDMADIGRAARRLGCQVVSSDEFLKRLSEAETAPERSQTSGDASTVNPDSTEYWLRKFEEAGDD